MLDCFSLRFVFGSRGYQSSVAAWEIAFRTCYCFCVGGFGPGVRLLTQKVDSHRRINMDTL